MKLRRAVLFVPLLLAGCSQGPSPAGQRTHPSAAALKTTRTAAAVAPAAGKSRPALPTYQCLLDDQHVLHLRATVDRSGKKIPATDISEGRPVSLYWEDAPAGVDYHEEILGAWQSRQILATTYHAVSGPSDSPAEEATYCLLSCEDPGKEFRPFLMVMKDEGGIRSFGYKLKKSSSGQITGLSANWLYSGSGVGWVDADFKLTPDGPRLVKIANGGRHAPVTTRTYNAAGKVIRKTVEQLDP